MQLDQADSIFTLTFDVAGMLRRRMQEQYHEQGVNLHQLHGLLFIAEHEGMTMKELADILHISSPSTTSFVERLVRLGWVERRHDRANRKLVRLRLTKTGRTFLTAKIRERRKIFREIIRLLPPGDQRALAGILLRLSKALRSL